MLIFKGLLYRRTMKINTRKILATIVLLIAIAGWHCSCFGETVTISYGDTINPLLPTATPGYATATEHSNGHIAFGAAGIYKGGNDYIMFASGKGYLYNTNSLGHIDSVIVTYSSGVNTSAKFGVRFADTVMFERINTGNKPIKGKSASDTVTNSNPESGGYFQLSTSSANCQIVSIKIVYTQGNTQPPADNIPPKFTTGYPKTENITKNSFDLKVKMDEPCTVYYQVVAQGETAPTNDELLASDKTISVETKNTEYTATVTELASEANYNIYLIAKDTADNVQDDSTTITVTTLSAFVKTIALGDIEEKYYWGETANIRWTTNNITDATDKDSILIFKDGSKIESHPIDITAGEADILIGNTPPTPDTYGTNYSLRVMSGNVESEMSGNFTIVPTITIYRLLTDTTNKGESVFNKDIVRVKGLVTATKTTTNKNFTIQDGDDDFCATYVYNCTNLVVAAGDSVLVEGIVNINNGMTRIGDTKSSTSTAIITKQNNTIPNPQTISIADIRSNNGLINKLIRIENAIYKNKCFFVGNDSIHYGSILSTKTLKFVENQKYAISGALGKGDGKRLEIWPRSEFEEDIYPYSNDTTLSQLTIGGRDALNSDTVVFTNLNINGITATTHHAKASLSIRVNNNIVATSEWENYSFSPLDSVFVTVTAEDGTENTYKRIIDCKTLNFNALANNLFRTGETINLSWTSHNIAQISLILEFQNDTVSLTESSINADLNEWQYTIPNSMFGEGWIKAVSNDTELDGIKVTIADTRAPTVTQQNPANRSLDVKNALYVSMAFDEPISVAEGAKLIVNDLEFPIIAIGDSAAKSFINGLSYSTLYSVSLSNNAICDLAGNAAAISNWSFTTMEAPQPDLYFSEYSKGSSKYYEIYNPCDTTVDLSRYFVTMDEFKKNSRQQTILQLSGSLMPNEVLVVVNSGASAEIKRMADVSTTKTTDFTGDDLLGLFRKNGDENVLIDVLGPFGNCDVAANWAVAGTANASADKTIVRNVIICGTTDWAESAGTDPFDSQWTVHETTDLSSLGRHGIGHNAEILRMNIGGIAAIIDGTEATVSVEVPYGTDLTKLAVSRRISQGAQIFINDSLAADTIDFSLPVTVTVVAADSVNHKDWTIIVTMAPKPSSENNILTFKFVETTPVSVTIDTANAIINAVVAFNLDSLKLTPVITISDKAKVSSSLFRTSKGIYTAKTRWDFDEPQNFDVTAQDLTVKNWTVIVEKEPEPYITFSPLATNSFGTGETISLSWTSLNISKVIFTLDIQNNTIQLTDSAINVDLGEWQFIVPDAMFGRGLVKALRNGIALDSIAISITDTKAPAIVGQCPANGSAGLNNSLYISMAFDEPVVVADDAKLIIGDLEFPLMAVGDTAAKAFVNSLNYNTLHYINLSDGAIKDLAGNEVTINDWTFTTKVAPQPDLYFSEYAKGSGSNKYYEIYNPCDTAVDLSRYFVTMDKFYSGKREQVILQLSGWLLPNELLVVANSGISKEIKQLVDISTTKTTDFTGDDLLGLFRKDGATDTILIDVLGPFGECDVAANWAAAGIKNVSSNNTIVRDVIICGTTDWAESAGTDSLDSQWTVLKQNNLSSLGRHGIGHNAEILRMSIGGIAATIDGTEATVSVEVPYGTNLTEMAVSRRISQGAQMLINNSLAPDTLDFSQPVVATIVAGDSIGQKNWTINVTMAPKPSSDNNILTFSFVETTPVSVEIDTANATINAIVVYNLDSLKLTPVITIAEFASVSSTLFKSSKGKFTAKTRWDFAELKTFVVRAEDLSEKVWSVNVEKEPEPHLTFSPLADNSFETGDIINLSWTSHNISLFNLTLDIQGAEIQLTDSAINANLGEWNFIIPDGLFGNGLIKAVRNGIAIDSIAVNIADTKAPTVICKSPSNGASDVKNSIYIKMVFDEPIAVENDAKLKIGDLEFPITTEGDTAAKAFVSGLDYGTTFEITLPNDAIRDLAGNNAVIGDWTFTTRTAPQPDLYFCEYSKGSSNNKYYEIYNPCDMAVDLSRYFVTMDNFSSSGRSQASLQLSGWLLPDEVLVVANSSASEEIKKQTDVSTTKTTSFTGDDLLGLFRKDGADTVLIDVLGPFGNCDVASNWAAAGIENASMNHTIVRNVVICGTTNWIESAGTDSLDSQWTVLGKDDFSDLGRHGIGHGTEILKMNIGGIAATIDRTEATVSVEAPYGTDLTKLAVSRRISQGAQIFINDSIAKDTIDFSLPVTATVIAGDSVNQKDWTIKVTMAPKPSSDNNILTFSFVETTPVSVEIDTANATIDAVVAYNLDSLKLTPVITIVEFASVSSTLFKSSKGIFTAKTKWDFNEPKTITVKAEDLTQKVWNVRVEREKTQELTIKDIAKLDGGLTANVGKPVITEGVVIHIVTTTKGSELYIQDSAGMWSGIMVVDEGNLYAATLAIGDRIKISGIVEENFGMARIGQIEALTVLNSDIKVHTDTIIVEDARSVAYQNALVTIDSVVCTNGFDNLYTVFDSTNSIYIYNKYRISDFALEVDSMYRITGIVYYTSADNSYRIVPRTADDIVKLVRPVETKPIEPNPIEPNPIEPNPIEPQPQEPDTTTVGIVGLTDIGLTAYTVERTIIIENANESVIVFDIAGRLIATAKPAQRIVINAPHTGIYIIRTRQNAIKVLVE